MKKILKFIFSILTVCSFFSCASTKFNMNLQVKETSLPPDYSKIIDFIGFKYTPDTLSSGFIQEIPKNLKAPILYTDKALWERFQENSSINNFGSTLEKSNIAVDNSTNYKDRYTLKYIELYRSSKRYVCYIEIKKNSLSGYTLTDPISSRIGLGIAGAALTGAGFAWQKFEPDSELNFASFTKGSGIVLSGVGIGLLGLAAFLPRSAKSIFTYEGKITVHIYDKSEKQIIFSKDYDIQAKDEFPGSAKTEDMQFIYDFYGTTIHNALITVFKEPADFIEVYDINHKVKSNKNDMYALLN